MELGLDLPVLAPDSLPGRLLLLRATNDVRAGELPAGRGPGGGNQDAKRPPPVSLLSRHWGRTAS